MSSKEIIFLDTNVFIRLIIGDVKSQSEIAKKIFSEIENGTKIGQISILVINEIIWILEKFYLLKREIYIPKLLQIFALSNIRIVEVKKLIIIKILNKMQQKKFDFTDIYLVEIGIGNSIFSFDKDIEKMTQAHSNVSEL